MGRIPKLELQELISSDVFRRLRQLQLIDEIELRNLAIREEYIILREKFYSQPGAFEILKGKYSLSATGLRKILYQFKEKKRKIPQVFK
jgi:hypothetical protein